MNTPLFKGRKTITRDIRRPTIEARLVGLVGPLAGKAYNLDGSVILMGRDDKAGIQVQSLEVSRNHARLFRTDLGAWMLEDLKSSNGTFVNGLRVLGKQEVRFGDRLQLGGEALFVFTHKDMLEDQVLQLQRMEALGKMAGEVAHDFKNMLTVIFSTVDMLKKAQSREDLQPSGKLTDESLTRHLDRMVEASERSNELIQRLLNFAKPAEEKIQNIVDAGEVIREVVALCEETFPENLRIISEFGSDLEFPGDAGQIHQVVMNLLMNARDAMPDGGDIQLSVERLTLNTSLGLDVPFTPGDYVTISVGDTGPGMDEATRLRAFEPFFTTKPEGKGTGLGLATVYAIAARHNGHAIIEGDLGQGTTVRVFLPCKKKYEMDRTTQPSLTADLPVLNLDGKTVLLVEPDMARREALKPKLEAAGAAQVLIARSGLGAIKAFTQNRQTVRLVLLEKDLPDLDCDEAVRALRRQDAGARILVLAGKLEPEEPAELRKAGALGVIPRDAPVDQFKEALNRA